MNWDSDKKMSWRGHLGSAVVLVPIFVLFATLNWRGCAFAALIGIFGSIIAAAEDYFLGISDAANEKRFDE